jgi:hypothetical protein
MNLSYSTLFRSDRSIMRLFAVGALTVFFIMTLFLTSTMHLPLFSSIPSVQPEPVSTRQLAPQLVPVPTPPQVQPALSPQASATPSPLTTTIHPVAQRVATPPVGN